MKDLILPEFDKSKTIDSHSAYVFDSDSRCALILGRDFLHKAGIKLDFDLKLVQWMNHNVPMKQTGSQSKEFDFVDWEDTFLSDLFHDGYATEMAGAKYEQVNPKDVADKQKHLAPGERQDLTKLLSKFPKLFNGELGRCPHRKVHLELKADAQPVHPRPYSAPKAHEDIFKTELEHLVEIGVLRQCGATEWASPTFIVPKKLLPGETAPRVRWVSDFRELNRVIRRRVHPLPRVQDILTKRPGYEFLTKLDISMQHCAFELDEESKELCTIVTPCGKCQCCRLPMGVSCSPDVAQEIMEEVMDGIDDADVCIDDIGAFSQSWDKHMELLEEVLSRLERNGFTVNPLKCDWGVKETDWLGCWLTPTGLKPWQKKIEGILKLDKPQNLKLLRAFIGAVNYYRDLWPRRSHVLKPLTDLTGRKFEWTDVHDRAFKEMKALVAADALLRHPDHNLLFEIYTDASDYQMGACIMQNGFPVAYFSKKLSATQQNYNKLQKELLSIVTTLSTFCTMLLGAKLHVYTDHKNLTFKTLNSSQALRWRLFLEEYDANYHYIQGKENVLADAFSCLPRMVGKSRDADPAIEESLFADHHLGSDMLDCFVNFPAYDNNERNPLDMRHLQEAQFEDANLQQQQQQCPDLFPVKCVDGVPVMCYRNDPYLPNNEWCICVPTSILTDVIRWCHTILGHAGITRVYDTSRRLCHHPHLKPACAQCRCDVCEENKEIGAGHGELPPREANYVPWEEVDVDLIGPWKVRLDDGTDLVFDALTCVDPVTNLVELIRIDNKTVEHAQHQFQNSWLDRYPWPKRCVHDKGGEFIGEAFQNALCRAGIKDHPTTSRNPQSNAICERMHQTIGNVLRTTLRGEPPSTADGAAAVVDNALATAMHATRSAASRTLGHQSPGVLAFNRDMFLNVPFLADLEAIRDKRQMIIDENLRKSNAKRRHIDYAVGDQVWIKEVDPSKLDQRGNGPYPITRVHANGTVTLQRRPHATERINLRRFYPHKT